MNPPVSALVHTHMNGRVNIHMNTREILLWTLNEHPYDHSMNTPTNTHENSLYTPMNTRLFSLLFFLFFSPFHHRSSCSRLPDPSLSSLSAETVMHLLQRSLPTCQSSYLPPQDMTHPGALPPTTKEGWRSKSLCLHLIRWLFYVLRCVYFIRMYRHDVLLTFAVWTIYRQELENLLLISWKILDLETGSGRTWCTSLTLTFIKKDSEDSTTGELEMGVK